MVPACLPLGYCGCSCVQHLPGRLEPPRRDQLGGVFTLAEIKAQTSHINPVILPSCGEWFGHPSQCQGNVTASVAGRSWRRGGGISPRCLWRGNGEEARMNGFKRAS